MKWSMGTPPLAGWYCASHGKDETARRYWNGTTWSAPCYADDPLPVWEKARYTVGETQAGIEWMSMDAIAATVMIACTDRTPVAPRTCGCAPGVCTASPDGLRLGRVSIISDLRCKATTPAAVQPLPALCECAGGQCQISPSGCRAPGEPRCPVVDMMPGQPVSVVGRDRRKHGHYFKSVSGLEHVDVYRVLSLFNVTDQALGHAIKKLLVAGGRGGGKDISRDIQEAIDTLIRWQEMQAEVHHA